MTMKIKSTHPESQGEFVIIDKENFNELIHELYEDATGKQLEEPKRGRR